MINHISSASDLARDLCFLWGPYLPAMNTREIWGAANTACGYFNHPRRYAPRDVGATMSSRKRYRDPSMEGISVTAVAK